MLKKTYLKIISYLRSITYKTALLSWVIILITLTTFVVFTVPFQQQDLINRMKVEANDIASSIIHANSSALVTGEFGLSVEHCTKLVEESKSLEFVIITRKDDGYSLLFTRSVWKEDTLSGIYAPASNSNIDGAVQFNEFADKEIFLCTVPFNYSGLEWGWIHIGISLDQYNEVLENFTIRTVIIAVFLTIFSFYASLFFSSRLTRPITILDKYVKEISDGNLNIEPDIKTGDELESLSNSFAKMTKTIKESRDKLEQRVKERTSELAETNEILIQEVQDRLRAETTLNNYTLRLETLQEIYKCIISAKSTEEIVVETLNNLKNKLIGFYKAGLVLYHLEESSQVDYSITRANKDYVLNIESKSISEYDPREKFNSEEIVIINDLTKSNFTEKRDNLIELGIKTYLTLPLKFQSQVLGEIYFAGKEIKSFSEEQIEMIIEIGSQISIAIAQIRLEEQLENHALSLQNSLKEKEVMLKEIHHRVKNNLQIISSLLYLQSKQIKNKETLDVFLDSQNRVRSMALVHEKLYQSKDLSSVNFSEYIKNLASYISNAFNSKNKQIVLQFDLESVYLSIEKAAPLGLIVNELLSNCFKYAFPENRSNGGITNTITIELINIDSPEGIKLIVKDNGIGMTNIDDLKSVETLGLQLVQNLINQLEAEFSVNSTEGTEFEIIIRSNNK